MHLSVYSIRDHANNRHEKNYIPFMKRLGNMCANTQVCFGQFHRLKVRSFHKNAL